MPDNSQKPHLDSQYPWIEDLFALELEHPVTGIVHVAPGKLL